jgi:hypothetical protein
VVTISGSSVVVSFAACAKCAPMLAGDPGVDLEEVDEFGALEYRCGQAGPSVTDRA